jgi:hypothetical protein
VATDAEVARALEIVRDALGDTPRRG